jgi:hypothetical protein
LWISYIADESADVGWIDRLDWLNVHSKHKALATNDFSGCLYPATWSRAQIYDHIAGFDEPTLFHRLGKLVGCA